jgi:hypothetical protein
MSSDSAIWESLDGMATAYQRSTGVRPDRMRIGARVAEVLEPAHGEHPLHLDWSSPTDGVWFPARPAQPPRVRDRWKSRRACRAAGGHWWHPADAMIEWFCCRCGADRDGMPKDGT